MLTAWTLGGEKSLYIENINLLIRFNKIQETFSSVTRVLSILLKIASTSATIERANYKECIA